MFFACLCVGIFLGTLSSLHSPKTCMISSTWHSKLPLYVRMNNVCMFPIMGLWPVRAAWLLIVLQLSCNHLCQIVKWSSCPNFHSVESSYCIISLLNFMLCRHEFCVSSWQTVLLSVFMFQLLRTVGLRAFSMASETYTSGTHSAAFVTCPNDTVARDLARWITKPAAMLRWGSNKRLFLWGNGLRCIYSIGKEYTLEFSESAYQLLK